MKPHIYEGKSLFCLNCFRDKSDSIHTSNIILQVGKQDIIVNEDCPGHKCAKCNHNWFHNYVCKRSDRAITDTICQKCIGDSSVLINRMSDLDRIANQERITPREAKEIEIEHESFLVLNIFHDPKTGLDNPNWLEDWTVMYKNFELMIEKIKIKQSSMMKGKAQKQLEENTKLSPEERMQYERDAKKRKKTDDLAMANDKEAKKKAYERTLKSIAATLRASVPGLSEEKSIELAKTNLVEPI